MQILEVLKQIAMLPVKVAEACLAVINNGTAEDVNLTITVGGRKIGLETKVFLFDQTQPKGASAAAPPA